jgi:hypothetical protein
LSWLRRLVVVVVRRGLHGSCEFESTFDSTERELLPPSEWRAGKATVTHAVLVDAGVRHVVWGFRQSYASEDNLLLPWRQTAEDLRPPLFLRHDVAWKKIRYIYLTLLSLRMLSEFTSPMQRRSRFSDTNKIQVPGYVVLASESPCLPFFPDLSIAGLDAIAAALTTLAAAPRSSIAY